MVQPAPEPEPVPLGGSSIVAMRTCGMPERFEANIFSPDANRLMKKSFDVAWQKARLIEYDAALTRQLLASAIIDQVNAGTQDQDQIVTAALAALAVAKNIAK
jgi:hypothetical protein